MSESEESNDESWEKMSQEEKKKTMKKMMKSFFSDMKGSDMKNFMSEMMGSGHKKHGCGSGGMMRKMMKGKGHKKGFNPMEMMGMMMGNKEGMEGFNPMEMCHEMMSSMHESQRISTMATPEVRGMFEDWVEQIEEEILETFEKDKKISVSTVAEHFKISKDSAYYFLTKLAQKGKIDLEVVDKDK